MRRLVLFALVATLVPATAHAQSEPGLALKWHLDSVTGSTSNGTVSDSSGNALDGHVTGVSVLNPARFSAGLTINGADLNSVNGFPPVGIDRAETLQLKPTRVTLMAWVRGTVPGSDAIIATQGTDSSCGGGAYRLRNSGGSLVFSVAGAGPGTVNSPASAGVWNGQWHAVAGVYDGLAVRLYVDGTQVGSGTALSAPIDYDNTHGGFRVGSANEASCGSATQLHAGVDEVRVYDRALTAGDIALLQDPNASTPPVLATQTPARSCNGSSTPTPATPTARLRPPTRAGTASPARPPSFSRSRPPASATGCASRISSRAAAPASARTTTVGSTPRR